MQPVEQDGGKAPISERLEDQESISDIFRQARRKCVVDQENPIDAPPIFRQRVEDVAGSSTGERVNVVADLRF